MSVKIDKLTSKVFTLRAFSIKVYSLFRNAGTKLEGCLR